ncbi:MAG: sigma-54-dependent Fis family transcriptional regulator [Elusimicrobia bacterium]|nr:sigma-54-dependent Fis family transcriptional regulator [Elusimicrobiota bacterium]
MAPPANMSKLSILVVEDEPLAQKVMAGRLPGHAIDFASDAKTARQMLQKGNHNLCFIDLKLGRKDDCSGLNLIPLAASKKVYTVVMTGHDSEEHVEKAYALGCDDFYAKGNEGDNVKAVLARYFHKRAAPQNGKLFKECFITEDPETHAGIRQALQYAPSDLPILILGPSGTGKTSLAKVLHDHSNRPGKFVAINCSAYTEDLLEAELFGCRRGAFTGAAENRKGVLLLADQGTLFLDEIGSMSLNMQAKLLKAIEEKSFFPLGSESPETSHFRIISATLEDIQSLVKTGRLRFDFFQRLHGLTIRLKPLARRRCDIFPLLSFFTRGGRRFSFSAQAKELLLQHDWPGNIRELKKLVDLLEAGGEGQVGAEAVQKLLNTLSIEEGEGFITEEQYRFARQEGLEKAVRRFLDAVIQRNLAENKGKIRKVLADLKVSTRLLYRSLKRGGHPPGSPNGSD